MPDATGTEKKIPRPLPPVAAGSHDDVSSTIVTPTLKSRDSELLPAASPIEPFPDESTRTATPTAAPELQPSVGRAGLRAPERYHILGEHGRGGLGLVSRARDLELGRDVAIKELISRGPVSEARFLREALITARLEHPGIVPIHEAGRRPDGTPFYAMKLVSGRPLRDLIAERTTVDQRMGLLHHVIAVADAIAYAHGRNIIHRDLKPANVIVGEFGETIVIDWGLAKDLSIADEAAGCAGPLPTAQDGALTATGAVLGTPTYMAPEQERGEHVDQRADVFAIGAMLWELCSLEKVPPTNLRQRHRMLGRSGIDKDFAAIVDKALAPDPKRRYPDAGVLVADLKAFKSGARIAARNYSLFAMLAHWTRRHRTVSLSVITVTIITVVGISLFIRNTADERDRADRARDQLTLEHAALLLQSDPTAAVATLANYHGSDLVQRNRLFAEARGRGVATGVLKPHRDTIWFAVGEKTGGIVSVGEDRRIRLTLNGVSTTLAADVSAEVRSSYAPATRLLAYAAAPMGIGLIDLNTRKTKRIGGAKPVALAFDPAGSRLASIDEHGVLTVWSFMPVLETIYRATHQGAFWAVFATSTRLVVLEAGKARVLKLDQPRSDSDVVSLSTATAIDVLPDRVVVGNTDGDVNLLTSALVLESSISVCQKQVDSVRFVAQVDLVAFICRDGLVGILRYDESSKAMNIVDSLTLPGVRRGMPSHDGDYVIFSGSSSTAYLYDIKTRTVNRLEGHPANISFIAPPTGDFKFILIGDVNGSIRVWRPPAQFARVLARVPSILNAAIFLSNRYLAVAGGDGVIRQIDVDSGFITQYKGHTGMVLQFRASADVSSFISFGYDNTVRVWGLGEKTATRTFATHANTVEDAEYVDEGRRIVSIGDDGRLFVWSPDGTDETLLFRQPLPLVSLEVAQKDRVVVADTAGSIWEVSLLGKARQIHVGDGKMTRLRASADGRLLAAANDEGVVVVYDTSDWSTIGKASVGGSVSQMRFDPRGRDLAIASEDGHVRMVELGTTRILRWHDIPVAARDIAYSSDGDIVGFICANGDEWFYSMLNNTWAYARDHESGTLTGAFSRNGDLFVSIDVHGIAVVRDVGATLGFAERLH